MTFDGIKDMRIGSKKVMSAWLDGRQVYPDSKRILDSLILWVDPKKQQATNESMAKNPKLTDLSGNGHDITCYNFGWAGMSGIGGYEVTSLQNWMKHDGLNVEVVNPNKLIISSDNNNLGIRIGVFKKDVTITLKISDIQSEYIQIFYVHPNSSDILQKITNEGVYSFTVPYNEEYEYNQLLVAGSATIELLPFYPGALVSDGVDDYGLVSGLPILTKERGYTVIAKRDLLNYNDGKFGILVSKQHGDTVLNICVEQFNSSSITNNLAYCRSFGSYLSFPLDSMDKSFAVQTSKQYNGKLFEGESTVDDTPYLTLFSSGTGWNLKSVLYSLLLFDRDLTTAEIEWVKENMVEADGVMMYDWMDKDLFNNYIENGTRATGSINSNKIIITGLVNPYARFFETKGTNDKVINSYKIKVTGVTDNVHVCYSGQVNGTETTFLEISQDGIYTLPQIEGRTIGFRPYIVNNDVDTPVNITIQQLLTPLDQPLDSSLVDAWIFSGHTNEEAPYQIEGEKLLRLKCYNFAWNEEGSGFKDGALYFDGVDDYLFDLDRKIPKLDEYTVICKRYVTPGTDSCTASKDGYMYHHGAFVFELKEGTDIKTYSFEVGTSIDDFAGKESVSWQTKNSYNGIKLESSNVSDSSSFMVGKSGKNGNIYLNGYIKYFALYDRTLSEGAIQAEIRKLEYKWEKRLKNK